MNEKDTVFYPFPYKQLLPTSSGYATDKNVWISKHRIRGKHKEYEENEMNYTPLTYQCPKCGSRRVAQDPVCAEREKPLMLRFCCCDCGHKFEHPYVPPKAGTKYEEETTMKATYKEYTGELIKLERTFVTNPYVPEYSTYDLVIGVLKEGTYARISFTGVSLKDIMFSGCEVSFNG